MQFYILCYWPPQDQYFSGHYGKQLFTSLVCTQHILDDFNPVRKKGRGWGEGGTACRVQLDCTTRKNNLTCNNVPRDFCTGLDQTYPKLWRKAWNQDKRTNKYCLPLHFSEWHRHKKNRRLSTFETMQLFGLRYRLKCFQKLWFLSDDIFNPFTLTKPRKLLNPELSDES